MLEFCPNCGNKDTIEKLSDSEIYCPDCNATFKVEKGKVKPQPKGKLDEFAERLKKIEENLNKVHKDLYGESALPFFDED